MDSNYHAATPPERKAKARATSERYLRAMGRASQLANSDAAGEHILNRTEGPNADDIAHLERTLRKATKTPLADSYTKGYNRQLTPQQQIFLDQMLKGDTMIHAHEVAYPNQKSTRKTRHDDAYHLMQHPVITAAMHQADAARLTKVRMNASQIREFVIERLLCEATTADQAGARVRSLELLGKVAEVGMFVTRTETTNVTIKPSELQATLLAKLKQFFERQPPPLATITDNRGSKQGLTIDQAEEVEAEARQQPEEQSVIEQSVSSSDTE